MENELKNKITPAQWEMHELVKTHDVAGLRAFLVKNPSPAITEEQLGRDDFLFDLMHVYKALQPWYTDHKESLDYCLKKGIIKNGTFMP